MTMDRALPVVLGLVLCVTGCRITDHSEKDPNAITTEALNVPASGFDPADTLAVPRFVFDSTTVRFGRIAQGAKVEHVFRFTNAGKRDLIIADVRSTCGCTVGKDWPKQPVHAGEAGTITVTFDSEGKSGVQEKVISVVANTVPATTPLLLKGEVLAPAGASVNE